MPSDRAFVEAGRAALAQGFELVEPPKSFRERISSLVGKVVYTPKDKRAAVVVVSTSLISGDTSFTVGDLFGRYTSEDIRRGRYRARSGRRAVLNPLIDRQVVEVDITSSLTTEGKAENRIGVPGIAEGVETVAGIRGSFENVVETVKNFENPDTARKSLIEPVEVRGEGQMSALDAVLSEVENDNFFQIQADELYRRAEELNINPYPLVLAVTKVAVEARFLTHRSVRQTGFKTTSLSLDPRPPKSADEFANARAQAKTIAMEGQGKAEAMGAQANAVLEAIAKNFGPLVLEIAKAINSKKENV